MTVRTFAEAVSVVTSRYPGQQVEDHGLEDAESFAVFFSASRDLDGGGLVVVDKSTGIDRMTSFAVDMDKMTAMAEVTI